MCGRFAFDIPPELLAEIFGLAVVPDSAPNYNIAPTQMASVVRQVSGHNPEFTDPGQLKPLYHPFPAELLEAYPVPDPVALVIEGGGNLATVWEKEAERRGLAWHQIGAGEWRQLLLYSREQRSGPEAKKHAGEFARKVIEWSGTAHPTSLRHDAAEAIMIGL